MRAQAIFYVGVATENSSHPTVALNILGFLLFIAERNNYNNVYFLKQIQIIYDSCCLHPQYHHKCHFLPATAVINEMHFHATLGLSSRSPIHSEQSRGEYCSLGNPALCRHALTLFPMETENEQTQGTLASDDCRPFVLP